MKTKLFKDRHSFGRFLDKLGMTRSAFGMTLALTLLMAVSCSKSDSPAPLPDDEAVAVQFSSNIGGISASAKPAGIKPAAVGSSWDNNDNIGVFMVDNTTTTVRNDATNKRYVTASGNGNFAPYDAGNTLYYPVNGDKVDFIAYYPYQSSITTLGNYNVNVATQTNQAAIDLLYAKATNGGSGYDKDNASPIALNFSHKLSKLELSVSATTASGITVADLASMTVKIKGLNTTASFDLAAGTLGTPATPADITFRTVTAGSLYDAILLPTGAFTAGNLTVEFTIASGGANDGIYTWNVPAGAFDPATQYNYAVAFGDGGVIGVITGGITPWEPGGTPTPSVIAHSAPDINETLNANKSYQFEWTTIPNVTAYSIKFAGSAADLATTSMSADVGNGGSYILSAETLEAFLTLAGVPADGSTAVPVYWTVVPTDPAQYSSVAVQVSMFKAIRQYIPPKSAWTIAWKSSEDAADGLWATYAIDGNEGTFWAPAWGAPYIPCQILINFGREILIHKITIVATESSIRPTTMAFQKQTPDGAASFLFPACDGTGRDVFTVNPPVLLDALFVLVTSSTNADWTHISEVYVE
jgi:hypothetical protein